MRVGYSFNDTSWARKLNTLSNNRDTNFLDISWKFNAHHYQNKIDSLKTRHEKTVAY